MAEPANDKELSAWRRWILDGQEGTLWGGPPTRQDMSEIIARLDTAEKARDASILARVEMIFKCGELEDQLEFSMMEMSDDE